MEVKELKIYTDGACSGNPGPGGWAVVVIEQDRVIKQFFGAEALTTNNKMELTATISALQYLSKIDETASIYTDSNYVKKGITEWIHQWKKNNWRTSSGSRVKNIELWKQLDGLHMLKNVEWHWVKAHDGNLYNEMVDKLARKQCKK